MELNHDEAKADYLKELKLHPDNASAAFALASVQSRDNDSLGARHTLQDFYDHHSDNAQIGLYLASLQNNAHDYNGALRTLNTAAEQSPDDRHIRIQISYTLLHLNRKEEAAAAAKSVLDGTDDPEWIGSTRRSG